MPIVKNVIHQFEVNPLACGQAVISMLSGVHIETVFDLVKTKKETKLSDMFFAFSKLNINIDKTRKTAEKLSDLPDIALLSLETPKCWHWSLYFKGKIYDPEHGILSDFPECNRKYFWEINEI